MSVCLKVERGGGDTDVSKPVCPYKVRKVGKNSFCYISPELLVNGLKEFIPHRYNICLKFHAIMSTKSISQNRMFHFSNNLTDFNNILWGLSVLEFVGRICFWYILVQCNPQFTCSSHRTVTSSQNPAWITAQEGVCHIHVHLKAKGKAIPVTGHKGPYGCKTSRLPHFL
jgi:hypothetical protein